MTPLRALSFRLIARNAPATTLLCLDYYFEWVDSSSTLTAEEMTLELHLFHHYVKMLSGITRERDPTGKAAIIQVFGVRQTTENDFSLHPRTFIYQQIAKLPGRKMADGDLSILRYQLAHDMKRFTERRLQAVGRRQEEIMRNAASFTPCLPFMLTRQCRREPCREAHLAVNVTPAAYNLRVKLHLQEIFILDIVSKFDTMEQDFIRRRKFVFTLLYSAHD